MNNDTDKNANGGTKPFAAGAQATKPVTPNSIAHELYPRLREHGDPFSYTIAKRAIVRDGDVINVDCWVPDKQVNEEWFGAFLAKFYVYDEEEGEWYKYQDAGYYEQLSEEKMHRPIEWLLKKIAAKCPATVLTKRLLFDFKAVKAITPMIVKGRGFAGVRSEFWKQPEDVIPVRNGALDIIEGVLRPHSPMYHFRGVMPYDYKPDEKCPQWVKVLEHELDKDDIALLQMCFGVSLLINLPQKMLLMIGATRSSKGLIATVWKLLVGAKNTAELRTRYLADKFELGRLLHKKLLYGADVESDFLSVEGAFVVKRITGQDAIVPEYKHSNVVPAAQVITGFPVVTANSRLKIRFQGDKGPWTERIIVLEFNKTIPEAEREPELAARIMDEEGSGVLNWALAGLQTVLNNRGQIALTQAQQARRDALLDESESSVSFAREEVVTDEVASLTADDAYDAYVRYCRQREWAPETPRRFWSELKEQVTKLYGITQSHDLGPRRSLNGWRGLCLKRPLKCLGVEAEA